MRLSRQFDDICLKCRFQQDDRMVVDHHTLRLDIAPDEAKSEEYLYFSYITKSCLYDFDSLKPHF